jgi:hypothetical protein
MLNRIPDVKNNSAEAMSLWFAEMAANDLIYHPENEAADLVDIENGKPFFTQCEAKKAQSIMDGFYSRFKYERVMKVCYPHFMKAAGFQP